jgi:exosortase
MRESEVNGSGLARRNRQFVAAGLVSLALLSHSFYLLGTLAYADDRYTHTLLVPLLSASLLWLNRSEIFGEARYSYWGGLLVLLVGIGLWAAAEGKLSARGDLNLSLGVLGIILVWAGLFVFFYGFTQLKRAAFPFLFLLFMIPLPDAWMNAAVIGLQKGSAGVAATLFGVIRMPFIQDGFRFALPGISIEVAEECSGIRSTLSIFLIGLLAADLFLQSNWSRLRFMLLIVPVVIFKNALRIATIAWLGVYVDRSFFFGNLHHYGGFPFSLIAFAILGATLLRLRNRKPATGPA